MSVQAMSWVLDHSDSKLGARLVLIAIANHADLNGENCWASVKALAGAARLSERQTRASLRILEGLGEVEETGKHPKHGTHVYRLPKMAVVPLPGGADIAPAESAPGSIVPLGGQNPTDKGARTAPEPSRTVLNRPRDELFEVLAEIENADLGHLTRSARGKLNDATKQLREVGASASDVRDRAAVYRRVHPTWDLTAPALVKHWPNLIVSVVREPTDADWRAASEAR